MGDFYCTSFLMHVFLTKNNLFQMKIYIAEIILYKIDLYLKCMYGGHSIDYL